MPLPKLIAGPYAPTELQSGTVVTCLIRGQMEVCGMSDAPIRWPLGRRPGTQREGRVIVTEDLARAIRTESATAVGQWWGLSHTTVCEWRRALGVAEPTPGTWAAVKAAGARQVRRVQRMKARRER
jgi:hypothetical protein